MTKFSARPVLNLIRQPIPRQSRLFLSYHLRCLGISLGQFLSRFLTGPALQFAMPLKRSSVSSVSQGT